MTEKIENAVRITKELINIMSQEDRVKMRCQELEKDNEGFVMLIQIHNIVREYGKLSEEVKSKEFNELQSIDQIRGMLAEHQSWFTRRYTFKEMAEQTYNLVAEAKQILSYLENEERESFSDIEITFNYKGSKWTFGQLLALEDNEAITNYSEISIDENETYLHKENIEECIKKHNLKNIEDTMIALENSSSVENYDREDIREFLSDYDCDTIQQYAGDFSFYNDRDSFDDDYVDEVVLSDISDEVVKICFDYEKYWTKYARYSYIELNNGTIAYNNF